MEPQIQFCTSADGTSIAYATMGEGVPLVSVPVWCGTVENEWKHPQYRSFIERLAQKCLFVQWDRRGIGLSQRDVDDISLEAHIADLTAVADDLEMERFSLFGCHDGAAVAIAFAAQHPDRISRLVLWASYSHGEELGPPDQVRGLAELIRKNWSLAPRAIADFSFPTGPIEEQRWWSRQIRQSVSPEVAAKYWESFILVNIRTYLPRMKAPTLVLHRLHDRSVPVSAGRRIAALIPDSRFIELEGDITVPYAGDISYLESIKQFLEGREVSGSKSVSASSASMIGRTISHFRILDKLGEGGMGVVYKAEDTKLKRRVALKFLPPELTRSDEWEQRFLREAQAAASLTHPNICTIYEIDKAEGQTFIAMECIDGRSLAERIESGQLNIDEALDITIQIAEGLRRAHGRGIVHRDIKSANILVDEYGQAKILDFGLAKLTEQSRLTRKSTIMGTVSYMSPEQARGDEIIDYRTDIWSLGAVLYEMLTGRLPFKSTTDAGLIYKIIHEKPESIETIRSDIPESLIRAFKKTMQKKPEERYESMEALISDLEAIRAGVPPQIILEEKTTPSIAVLPFADMSQQKDQEYFCDGIAEELINALAQLRDLQVIARISAFSFKGQNLDVRDIGKKLDVDMVLQGSVRKAGNRIRITAQLAETASGHYLWSEKYDRELEDIFAIQDDITVAIVNKLKPKLMSAEEAKPAIQRTASPVAHDLCLKGRYFLNRWTPTDVEKAIACFEQAIEEDSDYALAYVELADSYNMLSNITPIRPNDIFPKATTLVLKALKIDDTISEAHELMGWIKCVYEWDWVSGERELRLALELNPGNLYAHLTYAQVLTFMGRYEEAIEFARRGVEMDPLSPIANIRLADVLNNTGKFEESTQYIQKSIEMFSNYPYARMNLGGAYLGQSMYEEALREFQAQKDLSLGPLIDVQVDSNFGAIYAFIGETAKAEKIVVGLEEKSKGMYVPPSFVGRLYYVLGHHDKAFEWLERAYEEHDFYLCHLPILTRTYAPNLLSDPRYQALLKKIGLAD